MLSGKLNSFFDFFIKSENERDVKVKGVKYFSLFAFIIHSLNTVVLIVTGSNICVPCMIFISIVIIIPVFFYWLKFDYVTKVFFCLGLPIVTSLFSSFNATSVGTEFVYFPFLFMMFFLIPKLRDRVLISIVYLVCYVVIIENINVLGLDGNDVTAAGAAWIKNMTYFGCFLVTFIFCQYFFSAIQTYQKSTNRLLEDLQIKNGKLESANSELERFNYIASHDLKSPLRNVISFINLIERDVKKKDYNQIEEYMEFIKKGSQNMYQLIEDILKYSKIKDVSEREKNNINLNVLCEQLNNVYQGRIKYAGLPEIIESPLYVKTIFQNLIENGLKYNKSLNPMIEIKCVYHSKSFDLMFKDNGIGIDPRFFDQIFEMFKRLHSKIEYEGTGIGLAIVKRILEQMGAKIAVKSEFHSGTTFTVTLPNECLYSPIEKEETKRKNQLSASSLT